MMHQVLLFLFQQGPGGHKLAAHIKHGIISGERKIEIFWLSRWSNTRIYLELEVDVRQLTVSEKSSLISSQQGIGIKATGCGRIRDIMQHHFGQTKYIVSQ